MIIISTRAVLAIALEGTPPAGTRIAIIRDKRRKDVTVGHVRLDLPNRAGAAQETGQGKGMAVAAKTQSGRDDTDHGTVSSKMMTETNVTQEEATGNAKKKSGLMGKVGTKTNKW
jgi:hypothetical protein